MVSVLEKEKQVEGKKGVTLHKYSAKLSQVSMADYRYWLFSEPHSVNKDKLLELTTLQFPLREGIIVYYQATSAPERLLQITQAPFSTLPQTYFTKSFYSFHNEGHFYVDFAHPELFGGSFRSFGNAQEETLFYEFPQLVHLAYATTEHPLQTTQGHFPTPLLIPHVKRHLIVHDLYGTTLEKAPLSSIASKIEYLDTTREPHVHILAMSALDFSKRTTKYRLEDLQTLFYAAFLAFEAASIYLLIENKRAVIHTSAWGCGVFANSAKTSTVIQLLAATLAGVDIVFEDLESPRQPDYTETFLEEAKQLIATHKNAQEVFKTLLALQEKDLSWAPKALLSPSK